MKKFLLALLCALALAVPALAEEDAPPDWLIPDYVSSYGEEDASEGTEPGSEPDPEPPAVSDLEPSVTAPAESEGKKDDTNDVPDHAGEAVDSGSPDRYPVGSYIDSDGQVWPPSGPVYSPEASQVVAEDETSELPSDVLGGALDGGALAVIPPVWYVTDLRPADDPQPAALGGLKSLVASIFGEYTPVTTTSVITETVGNENHQYLIESVAPGSAGVDYEWLAGVLLFAILLYCLMRLLGGVLK